MRDPGVDLGIPKSPVFKIMPQDLASRSWHEMCQRLINAKLILQLLLPKQKEHCAAITNGSRRTV